MKRPPPKVKPKAAKNNHYLRLNRFFKYTIIAAMSVTAIFGFIKGLFPASAKNEPPPMYLIVGLGNPGDKYSKNRHNIGFMAVDKIAEDSGFPSFRDKFQGGYAEGRIGGQKVGILKPQTYMNNSGQSVSAAAKFYKIPPERVITFFDELDLDPGKVKIKVGGGNAGHNGLKSIQAHLGTPDFKRVRIGIGHPGQKDKVTPHVLGDFSKADHKWLEPLLDNLARYIDLLIEGEDSQYIEKLKN